MLTDGQVWLYRQKRTMNEMTQESAAAAAGISVRSGRSWETGPLPSETTKSRSWRTRADPLAGVWDEVVVPLLESDTKRKLQAKTLLLELRRRDPECAIPDWDREVVPDSWRGMGMVRREVGLRRIDAWRQPLLPRCEAIPQSGPGNRLRLMQVLDNALESCDSGPVQR